MELSEEQISDIGLNEEQTAKLNTWSNESIASAKQGFDGLANKNAEAILDGALGKIATDTNINRTQGEKAGDYINRAWSEFNSNKLGEVNTLKTDYETKIKDFKGDKDLITKISTLEADKDGLLQKYANYDELKTQAELYNPLLEKYNTNKLQVAFNSVKPNFPDTVNKYEADAKWGEFKNEILDKYDLEIVDGEPKAIDKENKHRVLKLSDLLSNNENINALLKGRQQAGTNSKEIKLSDIEGVPFKVPENIDAEQRSKLIREYLATKGISSTSNDYAMKFTELNKAILSKK